MTADSEKVLESSVVDTDVYKFIAAKVQKFRPFTYESVRKKSRKRVHVEPRHLMMYFLNKYTPHSLAVIGMALGGRSHATVLHAKKAVKNYSETDKFWNKFITEAEIEISNFVTRESKKQTTKYNLFRDVIESFIQDPILQEEYIKEYLKAK